MRYISYKHTKANVLLWKRWPWKPTRANVLLWKRWSWKPTRANVLLWNRWSWKPTRANVLLWKRWSWNTWFLPDIQQIELEGNPYRSYIWLPYYLPGNECWIWESGLACPTKKSITYWSRATDINHLGSPNVFQNAWSTNFGAILVLESKPWWCIHWWGPPANPLKGSSLSEEPCMWNVQSRCLNTPPKK